MDWIETRAPLGTLDQGTSLLNFTPLLLTGTIWSCLGSGLGPPRAIIAAIWSGKPVLLILES